jgi:hypothetical protein
MVSVTQRIKGISQPRGGYIKPKEFTVVNINDNVELNSEENIHSSLVGLAVDYLTRYSMGTPPKDAFKISLLGASLIDEPDYAQQLLYQITGLDDKSITNACKLTGYDVVFRAGPMGYRPVQDIAPDSATISNIRTMVNRSVAFMKKYGPIVKDGFTFEGGYTEIVTAGDGDFLTGDTLWDFKVSTKSPTNAHTLQLLMYYIMGQHSIHKEFRNIKKLGFFNPRLNDVYTLDLSSISPDIIRDVSSNVIGYKTP